MKMNLSKLTVCVAVIAVSSLIAYGFFSLAQAKVEKAQLEYDPYEILLKGRDTFDKSVEKYRANFYRQERIKDKVGEEENYLMKIRENPFSVYMKLLNTRSKGREVLYVEGKYDNKMKIHLGGWEDIIVPSGNFEVNDPLILERTHHPINNAGINNLIGKLLAQFKLAMDNGDLRVSYLGSGKVGDRKTLRFKRLLPAKKDNDGEYVYYCKRLMLDIDEKYQIPLQVIAFNFKNQLWEKYRYEELKFNPSDLTDDDWDAGSYTGFGFSNVFNGD